MAAHFPCEMAQMVDPEAATLLGGPTKVVPKPYPRWLVAGAAAGALALGGGLGLVMKRSAVAPPSLAAVATKPVVGDLPEFLKDLTADEVTYCECGSSAEEQTTACCAVAPIKRFSSQPQSINSKFAAKVMRATARVLRRARVSNSR